MALTKIDASSKNKLVTVDHYFVFFSILQLKGSGDKRMLLFFYNQFFFLFLFQVPVFFFFLIGIHFVQG